MKSKRLWLTLIVLAAAGAVFWGLEQQRGRPPQVAFARVERESISSLVSTNGKVEPVEPGQARAERSGAVKRILVQHGQHVEAGQILVELDASDAEAELKTARHNRPASVPRCRCWSKEAGRRIGQGSIRLSTRLAWN